MSMWARKKQAMYLSIVSLVIIVSLAIPAYFVFFRHTASCFDGILNLNETGIDCGGICNKVCALETRDPIANWQRFFKVTTGLYNVVAMVQNPNIGIYANNVPYTFRLYDEQGAVIAERQGTAFMYPNKTFPIFESGFLTGERIPIRVTFDFGTVPEWQKKKVILPDLVITDEVATSSLALGTPEVDASIENRSNYPINSTEVVAIVYDSLGNAMGASHTVVDVMQEKSKTPVVFTWPLAFPSEINKVEVTPKPVPSFSN